MSESVGLDRRFLQAAALAGAAEITRTLQRIGGVRDVGLKIFSDSYHTSPALEAGRRGGESLCALLASTAPSKELP